MGYLSGLLQVTLYRPDQSPASVADHRHRSPDLDLRREGIQKCAQPVLLMFRAEQSAGIPTL